jgi:membrane protease YdiL (CAAX protease family)
VRSLDARYKFLLRAIAFVALSLVVENILLDPVFRRAANLIGLAPGLNAAAVALNEFENFCVALICTGTLALYERRRVDSYGLPVARAVGRDTWEGVGAGLVMAAAVAIGMLALGGMQIRGLATTGTALATSALAWLGANMLVGLAEEFYFRSYFLQSLWKGIGFWPASLVISLLFAADHYFFKAGENVWDVVTLVSLSLVLCYSVLRTGTLWFAVGFHFAFDYMQLFVIGTPNGSRVPAGRLLDATFLGPTWLTGGVLGTEASFLMYPAIAALALYVWWRNRKRPDFAP